MSALVAILDPVSSTRAVSARAVSARAVSARAVSAAPASDIHQPATQPRPADPASHAAHTPHTAALRERTITLFCEGHRSPAIAAQLNTSERTVRAWLADARHAFLAHDDPDDDTGATDPATTARERIALAVERQLAIAAAAWQSYHHAVALDQLAIDHHRLCMEHYRDHPSDGLPPAPPRPSTACARFLSVALAAQHEAARLQGCYDRPRSAPTTTISHYPPTTVRAPSTTLRPQPPFRQLRQLRQPLHCLPPQPRCLARSPDHQRQFRQKTATVPCPPHATLRPTPIPARTATATTQRITATPTVVPIPARTATTTPASSTSSLRPATPSTTALSSPFPATPATAPHASSRPAHSSTSRIAQRPRHFWQHIM